MAKKPPKIEETTVCGHRLHCATCRDREGGRAWRASTARVYTVPGGVEDFECPLGVPWGYSGDGPPPPPKPPGPGTTLRRLIEQRHGVQQCAAGCGDLAARMDRNGPDWCEAHADEIAAEMMSRSGQLRWYQRWAVALAPAAAEAAARELVHEAIAEARATA